MMRSVFFIVILFFSLNLSSFAVEPEVKKDSIPENIFGGLKFRNLNPSFVSGRISDIVVNPNNHSEYFVAVASGHIWKTTNNGTTFKPVFDNYGVYAIGCLAMDPTNPNVVWAGTGENNHQRAIGYGNGVYKTLDGGKSWKNMGLEKSMQIGMIQIDPRNPDVVYVAAEGSIWGPGGDRGLYKSTDGGENWEKILEISENTGINNIVLSPDNPDILYVTSEQRRRRTNIRIGGGPESAFYKSTDAGKSFRKITRGLPSVDKGGMGVAVSPVNPQVVYLMIEAAMGKGGFFRSTDRAESFTKMSSYNTSGQYYGEIFCDPQDVNTVYATETFSKFTIDGGKTWSGMGNNHRHVDDHALWIDPEDTNHYIIGGDGGLYETFDKGKHFVHKTNLPVTQFYRVNVDNSEPFYYVYGGTQDNSSLGAPSGTLYYDGISRCEWIITKGGDGFWQAIDPDDPNIVYSESQYGNVARHDRKSGENTNIKPRERLGEETYKWNWNTPLILSKHKKTRLYMAANKVFKSEDRGSGWEVISDDITRELPRDKWPVMDRYWSVDGVEKNVSTSLYGTAVSIAESQLNENLLFVGTDDGLLQITSDMGQSWTEIGSFPGVPEYTYVSDILPSKHDENTLFVTFDNIKRNDFKPYILKSIDLGESWTSIASNLPENGSVHSIQQDHLDPDLLFAGTEFGVYFTLDGGNQWIELKAGIPDIAVKDIEIQERENDLVLATFGRGFYILDDYSPLREVNIELTEKKGHLFDVDDTYQYIQRYRGGYGFGSLPYYSKNPAFGAVFTYYLKEVPKTKKQKRRADEKELIKEKAPIPIPTVEELREEEKEIGPFLLFTIMDENGQEIRKINKAARKGLNRETWNLRLPSLDPGRNQSKFQVLKRDRDGIAVFPGVYQVKVELIHGDSTMLVGGPKSFAVKTLGNVTIPAKDQQELAAFRNDLMELSRVIRGSEKLLAELNEKVSIIKQSVHNNPASSKILLDQIDAVLEELDAIQFKFYGEKAKASYEERIPAQVTIRDRLSSMQSVLSRSSSDVTLTQRQVYAVLEQELPPLLDRLEKIANKDIPEIEVMLDAMGAPWTPGRTPKWRK